MAKSPASGNKGDRFYWEKLPKPTEDVGVAGSYIYIKHVKTATRDAPNPTPKPLQKESDWVEMGASDWISTEVFTVYPTPNADPRWKPAGDGTFDAAVDSDEDRDVLPTAFYELPINPEPHRNEIQLEYHVPLCNSRRPGTILHGYGECNRLNSTLCVATAPLPRGQHFCKPQHETVDEFRDIIFYKGIMNESWWNPSVKLRPDIRPGIAKAHELYDFYAGEVVVTRYGPLWSEIQQSYDHLPCKGPSTAATVAIAVGVCLAVLVPLAIAVFLWRKRRATKGVETPSTADDNDAISLKSLAVNAGAMGTSEPASI